MLRFTFIWFLLTLPSLVHASTGFGELNMQTQTLPKNGENIRLGRGLGKGLRCAQVFKTFTQAHLLSYQLGNGRPMPEAQHKETDLIIEFAGQQKVLDVPLGRSADLQNEFFDKAMSQWRNHGYTDKQVKLLEGINQKLPPNRVHWISFRFDRDLLPPDIPLPEELKGLASIRIFDGSTSQKVTSVPVRYEEGSDAAVLTPIELSPKNQKAGYRLPIRLEAGHKPVHLWHIGIGTNVKRFEGGLKVMFSHVAELLEMHYNNGYMKTFGSTKPLSDLNMMIVSSSKPDLVPYYQKLGFEVLKATPENQPDSVVYMNPQGQGRLEETEKGLLPDGMILIGMKASRFMELYYGLQDVPFIEIITPDVEYRLGNKELHGALKSEEKWVQQNRQLVRKTNQMGLMQSESEIEAKINELNYIFQGYIHGVHDFVKANPSVYSMNRKEEDFFSRNSQYHELTKLYRQFAEAFYMQLRRTPKKHRGPEWAILEMQGLAQLTMFPLEAFDNYQIEDVNPATGRMGFIDAFYQGL